MKDVSFELFERHVKGLGIDLNTPIYTLCIADALYVVWSIGGRDLLALSREDIEYLIHYAKKGVDSIEWVDYVKAGLTTESAPGKETKSYGNRDGCKS